MIPDKEFSFIGRLAEKDQKGDGKVFFNILEDGTACLKPIDAYLLHAKNKQNTIDMCWNFAYRQIEAKEEEKQEEATLGDLVGLMGGLMAAFAPPEQGKEIQQQLAEIGDTVGTVLQDVAKAMDTLSE